MFDSKHPALGSFTVLCTDDGSCIVTETSVLNQILPVKLNYYRQGSSYCFQAGSGLQLLTLFTVWC